MNENYFNQQITMRVYNRTQLMKLNKLYSACKENYKTKNPFLVECLYRGIEDFEKNIGLKEEKADISQIYKEITATIKKLNDLIQLTEQRAREIKADNQINQKLLSCNYQMLLGLSSQTPQSQKMVESGILDELPLRFINLFETLVKEYKNNN